MTSVDGLGAEIMARIEALATASESADGLVRRYLTPQHRRANDLVRGWMEEASMAVREDAVGSVVGRYEGAAPGAAALLIGSHLDTVVMAGKYDGMLGVVTGIACVKALQARGVRLPVAVEVIGFADEEGVRYHSTYLGSRAVAGTFDEALLERRDADGVRMADAMTAFGLDPARIGEAARRPDEILAYLEVHIEQGPVLEEAGLPVGAVGAITGVSRLEVTIDGQAGHAGTVPMARRRDALAAASACVLAVEETGRAAGTVATVGRLTVEPGAANVIPGRVHFTVDLRAAEEPTRQAALADLQRRLDAVAAERSVEMAVESVLDAPGVACTPALVERIARSIEAQGWRALRLPSGAGHDAAAMADLTDVGMIFVRCRGGISHHPAEAISEADAEAGLGVLLDVVKSFAETP